MASSGHVAVRLGNTYYYHPGNNPDNPPNPLRGPETKVHSALFQTHWVGMGNRTVKYKRL